MCVCDSLYKRERERERQREREKGWNMWTDIIYRVDERVERKKGERVET
jgi:hypothetical protein